MNFYFRSLAAVILSVLIGTAGIYGVAQADDAEQIVLVGDIDNLGYGFPSGFDVFSGASTPVHRFPFQPEPGDADGTDRIMVGTGYTGNSPVGIDGYTRTTSRPDNLPEAIELIYTLEVATVREALLQMFVDDFQAAPMGSYFQVRLNNRRATFVEGALNALNQTGPIGKLISLPVPAEFLSAVAGGSLTIAIDDPTTGVGDGYAVDFVRLLINPTLTDNVGTITGTVVDDETEEPLAGATVTAGGAFTTTTDSDGEYSLDDIPAGLAVLTASMAGYSAKTATVDLLAGGTANLDFELVAATGTSEEILLQHIFNAGVNLGWAQIHSYWRHYGWPPILNTSDGPTTETEIIADLNRLREHLEASGFPFTAYETAIDNLATTLQRDEYSLGLPEGCAQLVTDLQNQLGDAVCQLETGATIYLQHIFNAGVNLGWAQIHAYWWYYEFPPILNPSDGPTTESEISADLNRLREHLTASGFPFSNYDGPIDALLAALQPNDWTLSVAEGCARLVTDLQNQLGDSACEGGGSAGGGDLLVVTSIQRLTAKFGQQGYNQIESALQPLNPILLDVDSEDWTVIDRQIEATGGEETGTVLILGGDDIVPFPELMNPQKDQDTILHTDDPYADFDNDDDMVIDRPITRIPDGGDLDLVLTQLATTSAGGSGAFALTNRNRSFAGQIAQLINATPLWSAPTQADDISQMALQVPVAYFMLHGSGRSGARWYGELGSPKDWTALEAFHVSSADSQGVVLSGACYGAKIIGYTPADSIALTFLKNGARAFVGATAITYSDVTGEGANRLGGLFHRLFFEYLNAGQSPPRAFFNAKRSFANQAIRPVEKKISHIFVCYGRP